jgi:hypothetical protein
VPVKPTAATTSQRFSCTEARRAPGAARPAVGTRLGRSLGGGQAKIEVSWRAGGSVAGRAGAAMWKMLRRPAGELCEGTGIYY